LSTARGKWEFGRSSLSMVEEEQIAEGWQDTHWE